VSAFRGLPAVVSLVVRAALAALFVLAAGSRAFATDYVVTKTTDSADGFCDADCSLREAIIAANGSGGHDRIILGSAQTYTLTIGPADLPDLQVPQSGDLDITDELTIDGNGSTINANGVDRVLDVRPPVFGVAVTINNLSIVNGVAYGFLSFGGGLYIGGGATVTLNDSTVANNITAFEGGSRDNGGGIAVVGVFDGPPFPIFSSLFMTGSTVSNNIGSNGGGILCASCTLNISNSTISGNIAEESDGGGIDVLGDFANVTIVSSTLQGNSASVRGGALSGPFGFNTPLLDRSRIAGNTASVGQAISKTIGGVAAANNWWGCNFGPGTSGPGCPGSTNDTAGAVSTSPYLVLGVSANPTTIGAFASSTVTADLTFNSDSVDTSFGGTVPNGTTAAFFGTLGTFAAPTAPTSGGKATNLFTAGALGGTANLSTTVDGQSVSTSILIQHTTTTTLVGSPPSPVFVPEAVVLTATVSSPTGGTPTGTVTFRDGPAPLAGCSGAALNGSGVAACNIPGNSLPPGVKSFTAEYTPSGDFVPSTSAALSYTYVACTVNPVVTTNADSGAGSLRQAIAEACPASTITFNMGSVVSPVGITGAALTIARSLTITGPGANALAVQRTGGADRVFAIDPGLTVAIGGVTIAAGTVGASGGGIHNNGSALTLSAVTVRDNLNDVMSTLAGGLFNDGQTANASLTLLNSTVSGNSGLTGGGILSRSGGSTTATLTIANSTISGNTAGANGGGIAIEGDGSVALLTNSTITANRADGSAGFSSGGGIFVADGAVTLRNTLVAGNFVVALPITGINDVFGTLDPASAFSLIGTEDGMTGITNGVNGNQVGAFTSPIDPRLGPLQDNGGPTFTHAFVPALPASPALDAGDNTLASNAGLTLDQRGAPRLSDGADADLTDTVDIGAFEARASMTAVPDRTVAEDGSTTVTFDVGDLDLISTIVATSSNTALVPNNPANLAFSGSGTTRTLTITPVANGSGTSNITVAVTSGAETTNDLLLLTVTAAPDAAQITPASTNEDTQTTSGLVVTRSAVDGPEITHFRIGAIANGTLFQSDGTTPITSGAFITAAQAAAGLKFTPAPNFHGAGAFTAEAALSAAGPVSTPATGGSITVSPVADTPSITNTFTTVNTQSASGLVVTRNAVDGAEVTHVKVTAISGGTLFQNNGTTSIAVGAFITMAQGNAGLKFTPTLDSLTTGHVTVQAATCATDSCLGGSTAAADIVIATEITITTGLDSSSQPIVKRLGSGSGEQIAGPTGSFMAFSSGFTGGVRVADADLTGDGVADIFAGTGPGVAPRIVIFDGASGGVIADFTPGFSGTGGVFVAAGDVDGDGWPDIVAGDGGSSAQVRVFSGASGAPLWMLSNVGAAFGGGVRVAAGDVNGDGFADVVVGSGPGAATSVKIFSGSTQAELRALSPYAGFTGGVFVAVGDVNADGFADVITGADAGGGPHVRVFDGPSGAALNGFFAAAGSFAGGVRVAAGDVNGDGKADVIAARGPGSAGDIVQIFDGSTGAPLGDPIAVHPGGNVGLFVSTAVPANRMVVEAPPMGATLSSEFTLSGWAFQEGAPGIGVDAIHVWAYAAGGGTPQFLGTATLGDARPDIAALFGARYATAGYRLAVTGLADGDYTLAAHARNSLTGAFNMLRVVRVRVVSPGAELRLEVDQPVAGPIRPALRISGWALDVGGAGVDSGIEAVHIWAQAAAGGSPIFLGAATLRDARPDVAARFGPRAARSGYHLDVTGLAGGDYTLGIYAKSRAQSTFTASKTIAVTVTPWASIVRMALDLPLAGEHPSGSFIVAGWALALDAPSVPGIQAVHAWAYPVGGGAPTFLGSATLGGIRPDVAAIFGPEYGTTAYGLIVNNLASGTWDIVVFPLADGSTEFGAPRSVRITIP
jgi:fibronectin-binding autotransporter adhesin